MIEGRNILCFGSENWEYPGFQQTVMRKLSSRNTVIYVNSIGTRKFTIKVSQFQFYIKRLKRIFNPPINNPTSTSAVYSPRMIPIVYNNWISKLNKKLIRHQFKTILANHNFESYILWIGTPTAAFVLDSFRPELVVYHAVDRYSEFPFVDRHKIRIFECQIARQADVILCTSDSIRSDLLGYNKETYTVTHAVEYEHFRKGIESWQLMGDLRKISKPIIGYFGGLSERVNYNLIRKIADKYRHISIVLIGKRLLKLHRIENIPNIYILGHKDFKLLPIYLKHFSVCLIPYNVNKLMQGVDPIKLREYFCTGKPIVSVDLPEVKKFHELVYIGENEEDFVDKIGDALKENDISLSKRRIEIAKKNDWIYKMEEVSDIIIEASKRKLKSTKEKSSFEGSML